MSVPIHSIQHIKSKYKKFQLIAIIFALITLVAFILATLSSFLLANLTKKRASAAIQQQLSNEELRKQIGTLKDQQRQTEVLKTKLTATQKRLSESRHTIKNLESKIQSLEAELNSIKTPAVQPAIPEQQTQSAIQPQPQSISGPDEFGITPVKAPVKPAVSG